MPPIPPPQEKSQEHWKPGQNIRDREENWAGHGIRACRTWWKRQKCSGEVKMTFLAEKLQDQWLTVAIGLPRREQAAAFHKGRGWQWSHLCKDCAWEIQSLLLLPCPFCHQLHMQIFLLVKEACTSMHPFYTGCPILIGYQIAGGKYWFYTGWSSAILASQVRSYLDVSLF